MKGPPKRCSEYDKKYRWELSKREGLNNDGLPIEGDGERRGQENGSSGPIKVTMDTVLQKTRWDASYTTVKAELIVGEVAGGSGRDIRKKTKGPKRSKLNEAGSMLHGGTVVKTDQARVRDKKKE